MCACAGVANIAVSALTLRPGHRVVLTAVAQDSSLFLNSIEPGVDKPVCFVPVHQKLQVHYSSGYLPVSIFCVGVIVLLKPSTCVRLCALVIDGQYVTEALRMPVA